MIWNVFEDFHFHMTLSGPLDLALIKQIKPSLAALLAQVVPKTLSLEALTLMGQDQTGMFHQLCRAKLRGGA